MFVEIEHTLSLAYDAYIRESFLELRMQPKTTADQTLQSFVLAVGPPTKISRYRDWNGNVVQHFTIVHFHDRIEVVARSAVSTHPAVPALDRVSDARPFPEPLEGGRGALVGACTERLLAREREQGGHVSKASSNGHAVQSF